MNTLITDVAKKLGSLRQELAHNVWLAGLGAYSKSVEEVNGISSKSRSLMDELLERGREVERSAKEKVASTTSQTSSALEYRVHSIVGKVTGLKPEALNELDEKLAKLTKQVEALVEKQKSTEVAAKPAEEKVVAVAPKKPRARRRAPAKSTEE